MQRRFGLAPLLALLGQSPHAVLVGLVLLGAVGVALSSQAGSNWLAERLGGAHAPETSAPESALAIDWREAGQQAGGYLEACLRFDTSAPGPPREQAAQWLHGILSQAGVESRLVSTGPGRACVVARLPGQGAERPLVLYSRLDVLPPDPSDWTMPAFAGAVRDGYVYGCGALEPKGHAVASLMTLLLLRQAGARLERDVILLAVAGGEDDARPTTRLLEEVYPEAQPEFLLSAGGGVVDLTPGQRAWMVSTFSKGYLTLRVGPAEADGGPEGRPGNASERLVMAVHRLLAWERPFVPTAATNEFFRRLALRYPFPVRQVLGQAAVWPRVLAPQLLENPFSADLVRDTVALVRLEPWPEDPQRPSAVILVRAMPGRSRDALLAELEAVAQDPGLRFEVLEEAQGQESSWDTPFFRAIERVAGREQAMAPVLPVGGLAGGSDRYRAQGVTCYGFLPFDLERPELEQAPRGDERISLWNLEQGVRRYLGIVVELCAGR